MEIGTLIVLRLMMISFKIDLIVWKFTLPIFGIHIVNPFKIDLIVWKYSFEQALTSSIDCLK